MVHGHGGAWGAHDGVEKGKSAVGDLPKLREKLSVLCVCVECRSCLGWKPSVVGRGSRFCFGMKAAVPMRDGL